MSDKDAKMKYIGYLEETTFVVPSERAENYTVTVYTNGKNEKFIPESKLNEALAKIEKLKAALMSIKEDVGTRTYAWHIADEALEETNNVR